MRRSSDSGAAYLLIACPLGTSINWEAFDD
jgi:hypothetical protein